MFYLSFDCANKSLAIGLYRINIKDIESIRNSINPSKNKDIIEENKLTDLIEILYVDVLDIIPNKKVKDVDIIERTKMLKDAIKIVNNNIKPFIQEYSQKVNVIIEYQMNVNDKSRTVFNQLIYEYTEDIYNIIVIKPMMKNMISLREELRYCKLLKNYTSVYKCNKQHTKLNFLYFLDKLDITDKVKHIEKKNLDDIADTFMQVLAHLVL